MNFSTAEQVKDGKHCADMAQATTIPLLGFGLCNCSCVESLPVAPLHREEALVGKLTHVFLTLWKTRSSVGGKIKVSFSRAFVQQVSSDSLPVFY